MIVEVLASSSAGNCYAVKSGSSIILLDCGIPFKQIQQKLNFEISSIDGVLLSHSHKDHSRSVPDMLKAGVDVYLAPQTADEIGAVGHRVHVLSSLKQFNVGPWTVLPFELQHDVTNIGYLISNTCGEKLVYITDSCYCKYRFDGMNYIMLEVNYCQDTLDENVKTGRIDASLRNRIVRSHMSLQTALGFFRANDLSQVKEITLIHLSDSNSQAEKIQREVQKTTGKLVKIA